MRIPGCVAAPPPPVLSAPQAVIPPPGAQDPSLARNASLSQFASAIPDSSLVSQRAVALPTGPVSVTGLTLSDAVFFDFGSATPRPDAGPALDTLARAISASPPDSVLTVAGNTDAIGSAAFNGALSLARARAVVSALAARGISPARLAAIGFGANRPIAPNDSDEGRAENRRVELALSPSFAANAASFTAVVPVVAVAAPVRSRATLARTLAPLDVKPNRPDPVRRNQLGPPVAY
jgi:outer membrane protein OmpA-like peptidoglycan-associated protein